MSAPVEFTTRSPISASESIVLPEIYCLSYNNQIRRDHLSRVFESQNLRAHFYDGVGADDSRIAGRPLDKNTQRCWSIMYGHLDMLRFFIHTSSEYAIFCEDDILVRRDFSEHLPAILSDFKEFRLDVLLLGCLCSNAEFRKYSNFPELRPKDNARHPFEYYGYNSDPESAVWGTQMYMLHRAQAIYLWKKYADGYAETTLFDRSLTPFSSDWIITKDAPNKALMFPLVAIENYQQEYADPGQDLCRRKSYRLFYSEDLYA